MDPLIDSVMRFVFTIVFAAVLCVGGSWCAYLYRKKSQRLPEHVRLALEQFAGLAVQQVEQQNRTLSGEAKKARAMAGVAMLFKTFGLPAPSSEAIDIAIEAAVLWLPKREPPKTNG